MSNSSASFSYSALDESVLSGSYDFLVPFDQVIFRSSRETHGLMPEEVLITPISPTLQDFAKGNQPICIEYLVSSDGEQLPSLLSGVSPENVHAEIEWGAPLGSEEW